MRDGTFATELRAELERAVGNYRSRTKWYVAGISAAVAVGLVVAAVVAGSGGRSGSSGVTEAGRTNASPEAASSLGGGVPGDLGDTPAGDPTEGATAMENRAGFSVLVPNTPDANSNDLTGTYATPGKAVEMRFPPPDDASKELQPPYIAVTEFPAAEPARTDPAAEIERYLETAHRAGLTQQSACSVGNLPALCVPARAGGVNATATPDGGYTSTSYAYPNAAYVSFFQGNLEIHITGGASVDDLIKIAESMAPNGSPPSQTSPDG